MTSSVTDDYLKFLYQASEERVSINKLASSMGVAPSTASEKIQRLAADGWVDHKPYRGASLTPKGRAHAVKMVRKHRLIETFLVEKLDYDWGDVHDEAEVLEHAASDRLIDRIDAALGYPRRDPHGDPIPRPDGTVEDVNAVLLRDLPDGGCGTIYRISDADSQMLRDLVDLQVRPGVPLKVLTRGRAGVTMVQVAGEAVPLGEEATCAIWVEVEGEANYEDERER
ncbi:MAG: metal-dependent transcriptional regulator [Actinomycetaceae bacterium]|nr:metal-dependent transcriptional regulator [Actinomycetaceae bacterium]